MSRQDVIDHEYTQTRRTLAAMITILTLAALLGTIFEMRGDAAAFEVLLLASFLVLLGVTAAASALRARFGWRIGQ